MFGPRFAVIAAAALSLFAAACAEETHRAPELTPVDGGKPVCTACGACDQAFVITDRRHLAGGIEYPDFPPPGGPHDPCWMPWGTYTDPVPTQRWVHNLEHGGVVFLYSPGDDTDGAVAELAAFATDHPRVLVAPSPQLTTKFAAVAWGHRLLSECFDFDAAQRFYEERFGKGPESIDEGPPAACL